MADMAKTFKIPYGLKDFKTIREEGYYYVDKTAYIRKMEERDRFVFFVRPRRMGKSLFVETLRRYYNVNEKAYFQKWFGGLDIGENPTENANRYCVLVLDFSRVGAGGMKSVEEEFNEYMNVRLDEFLYDYRSLFPNVRDDADFRALSPRAKFESLAEQCSRVGGTPLYLIIDEYDNFTNTMLRSEANADYRAVTHGAGFYRSWFKSFKGGCSRIFMTGVSPVTMDDLTSGFNIAANLTQDEAFNAMAGFSEAEVVKMYSDFKGTGRFTTGDPAEIVKAIKPWYDGYCFSTAQIGKECVFNSDMALYYLKALVAKGEPPENMVDVNIKTDYEKLKIIADIQRRQCGGVSAAPADATASAISAVAEGVLPVTEQLAATGEISFDLVESFPADKISDLANFHSLFHYYGIVSMQGRRRGQTVFKIPNVCVRRQLFDYLRDAYRRTRTPDWMEWSRLAGAFAYDGDWAPFLKRLARDYAETTPVRGGLQGEIRVQGYMQAEFGHLKFYLLAPEMELTRGFCDFCLFPERVHYGDVLHSYIVELKYAKADATDAEMAAKVDEAKAQLAKYRADRAVPSLARGTALHQIVYVFRGAELHTLDEIACEPMP